MLDIKQNKTKTNKNPKAKTEQDNSNNKHSHIIKRKRLSNSMFKSKVDRVV